MAKYICKHCGYEGQGKRIQRGSRLMEQILWAVFVIPGPFYSVWRMMGRSKECPNCERQGFVKVSSDEGWMVKKKLEKEISAAEPKKRQAQTSQIESFGREVSQFEEVKQKRQVDPDQF